VTPLFSSAGTAGELHISEITVKAHRGKVMRKMGAGSLVDLVKMAERLGVGRRGIGRRRRAEDRYHGAMDANRQRCHCARAC
jgi:hypothetical protein